MTDVKTLNGAQLLIQIGDGATPETFGHDCLINTDRGIQFSADMKEIIVPSCDDPESPAWKKRLKDGLSAEVNGAGALNTTSILTWFNWFKGKDTKNVRIRVNVAGADGGGYWQGAFHCGNFQVTGSRNDYANSSVSLASDGSVTWADAA